MKGGGHGLVRGRSGVMGGFYRFLTGLEGGGIGTDEDCGLGGRFGCDDGCRVGGYGASAPAMVRALGHLIKKNQY